MIAIGAKMQRVTEEVEAAELRLFGEPGKAQSVLQQDAPHEVSEPPDDFKVRQHQETDNSDEEQQIPAKHSKKRVDEDEEVVEARRAQRKAELAKQNSRSRKNPKKSCAKAINKNV